MNKILFTHSYFLRFDPKEFKTMMPYAPLGTLYAASYVRSKGYSPILFDTMLAEQEDEIRLYIEQSRSKIVVIYDDDFNYLTKMCLSRMREAAFKLSKISKQYGCTVIVHGSDAVDHLDKYIENGADYVIIGEGEETLCELLDFLTKKSNVSLEQIKGIAYRDGESIHRNEKRTLRQVLDTLPFPAWDLVDVERYSREWKRHHRYFSINIVTTRGCPYHCNWCAKPIYGQSYNSRTPDNVAEEMLYLKTMYHPDHIWFCDDIFGLKPGWAANFAEAVKLKNVNIPFKCLSRADILLHENAIEHLSRSGCTTVWIGAESGSQKILDAMEKGTTVQQIYQSTRLMHEFGIKVGFFLQYGYPGETNIDIDLTFKMIKDCRPDEIGVSVSYPLPGTKFYEQVNQSLAEKRNWIDSQDLDLMFPGHYIPDFYRALHKVTHKKFRIWRGTDMLKRTIIHPRKLTRATARGIAAAIYDAVTLPSLTKKLNDLSKINPEYFHRSIST